MPCCKADEFHWCKELETITASDGEEYCIFHAPIECPEKQGGDKHESFNAEVYTRIRDAQQKGRKCDLSGTVFPSDFFYTYNCEDRKFPDTSFRRASFNGIVDFQNVIFGGKIDFSFAEFNKDVYFLNSIFKSDSSYFTSAKFKGEANFSGVQFEGIVSFHSAIFHKLLDLRGASFNNKVSFKKTTFFREATFEEVAFFNWADFRRAKFKGEDRLEVSFENVKFKATCDFAESTFCGVANFQAVEFKGFAIFRDVHIEHAFFNRAKFSMGAVFTAVNFNGKADFSGSEFGSAVYFSNSLINCIDFTHAKLKDVSFDNSIVGGGSFYEAKIGGVANFARIHTEWPLSFKDVEFEKRATFELAGFGDDVDFTRAIFYDLTTFIGTSCWGKLCFDKAILKDWLSFSKPDICEISFDGCLAKDTIFFDQANLEQAKLFNAPIESMDFVCCRWPKDENGNTVIYDSLDSPDPKTLEDAYRRLKKVAKRDNDEFMASAWHYKEKETCLQKLREENKLSLGDRFVCLSLIMYKCISGYGEKPLRAFTWLLAFVFAPLVILAGVKLWETGISNYIDPDAVRQVITDWARCFPLTKVSDSSASVPVFKTILTWFTQLVITFQFTLFAFALRNKFRR